MKPDAVLQANAFHVDVAASILDLLRQQATAPGERLSERELGKMLGLSRTPVRAALGLLAERGVVKLRPGSGWFVAKVPLEGARGGAIRGGGLDLEELGMRMVRDRFVGETENHFSEADFIKRYDVSRGDLRKTLIKLSQDGMVERARGHGWRFLPMLDNLRAQRASYDFRIAVETASIMASTFEVDAARLQRSKDEHQRLVASALHPNGRRLFEVNAGFHLMLAEFSRNEFFVQAIAHQNRLRRVIEYFVKVSSERLKNSCREHLAVIEALEKGDQRWASLLIERHLIGARDRLAEAPGTQRKGKAE